MSIRWQMLTLVGVALIALAAVGFIGFKGIGQVGTAMRDVGEVNLPSIQGLLIVSEGQTAVKAAALSAALYENDYDAQAQFAAIGESRRNAWERIDSGWNGAANAAASSGARKPASGAKAKKPQVGARVAGNLAVASTDPDEAHFTRF
jgi:methyl-accepting chemotaxis protein